MTVYDGINVETTKGKVFRFASMFYHVFYADRGLTTIHYELFPGIRDAFFVLTDVQKLHAEKDRGYYLFTMIDKHGKIGYFKHGSPSTFFNGVMARVQE